MEALLTLDQTQCKIVISPATFVSNVPGSRSPTVISVETDHLGTTGDVAQDILIELEIKSRTEQSLVKLLPINHQMTIRQEKKKERGQRYRSSRYHTTTIVYFRFQLIGAQSPARNAKKST